MKKLYRVLALVLVLGMVISLTACGAAPDENAEAEKAAAAETAEAPEVFHLELTAEQEQARQAALELRIVGVNDGEYFTILRSDGKLIPLVKMPEALYEYEIYQRLRNGYYQGYFSEDMDEEAVAKQLQELVRYYKEELREPKIFEEVWQWTDIVASCSAGNGIFGLDSQGKVHVAGGSTWNYDEVEEWTDITAIDACGDVIVGLKADGTVVAAGGAGNFSGDLKKLSGSQTIQTSSVSCLGIKEDGTPVLAGPLSNMIDLNPLKGATSFALGTLHVVGLFPDGTVKVAAYKDLESAKMQFGQCDVEDWTDIVAVAAGAGSSLGLKKDGTVVVAGGSNYTDEFRERIAALTDVVSISASISNSSDKIWGQKSDGNYFTLDLTEMTEKKQQFLEDWRDVYQVSCGNLHVLGLKADGGAAAFGENADGRCDVDTWTDLVDAKAGEKHSLGLKADGTAVAVGYNEYSACDVGAWSEVTHIAANDGSFGIRADGSSVGAGMWLKLDDFSQKKIVAVSAGRWYSYGLCEDGSVVFAGDMNAADWQQRPWDKLTKIDAEGVIGLRTDGTLQLHNNYVLDYDVSGWTDIVDFAALSNTVLAVRKDGTVLAGYCEGNNQDGAFDVENWTDIQTVAISYSHTLGLKKDGTVVATGRNDSGQCDVSGWTDIVAVAVDYSNSYGLKSDGTVVMAGSRMKNTSSPAYKAFVEAVSGWTEIVAMEVYNGGIFGIRCDGSVMHVVDENYARDYDYSQAADWTDIVQISVGEGHVLGLKSDGTVVAAGDNKSLQCQVNGF